MDHILHGGLAGPTRGLLRWRCPGLSQQGAGYTGRPAARRVLSAQRPEGGQDSESPCEPEGLAQPLLPCLWQSLTYPGETLRAWTGGAAPWIPRLGRAQSWSCGISCKESQAQKSPGVPSPRFSQGSRAREGEGKLKPVPRAPSSEGQDLGSLPGPLQLQ